MLHALCRYALNSKTGAHERNAHFPTFLAIFFAATTEWKAPQTSARRRYRARLIAGFRPMGTRWYVRVKPHTYPASPFKGNESLIRAAFYDRRSTY